MADRHSKIFGTEADRRNCPFFLKVGSCRHGDRCGRAHTVPAVSTTVLLRNMYANPKQPLLNAGKDLSTFKEEEFQDHFEATYEDIWEEVTKYGEVEEMMIADNMPDHLVGNVWVRFFREEDALKCLESLSGRFYGGKRVSAAFTSATDFGDARCRHKDTGRGCAKSWNCNFVHAKRADPRLLRELDEEQPHFGENDRPNPPEYDHDRKYGSAGRGAGGGFGGGMGGGGYRGGGGYGGGGGYSRGGGYGGGGGGGGYDRGAPGGYDRGGRGAPGGYDRGAGGGYSRGAPGGYERAPPAAGGYSRGAPGGYERAPPHPARAGPPADYSRGGYTR
ncbi:hypothetical protein FNF27_05145 [Cafeteria roenbergensis]|uniref:C3H1-type domain-containing protein n=1 Tax=Cafeteria roenbergensis TaxID=33653 RepID=A0A5A8E7T6_CAFRO|nr:hypothetical protein FNF29_06037 [Cafeteria roenbergensis]KAA0173368.1 hypothetical protein FNF27_05145 [Cafeteria roenbergensis]|eukprot:KAA0149332.1 hypothetical protein FNF29_06037 [Cafeteria roenbergensis]